MSADLRRLGDIISINGSIMLLLGDAAVAARWRGSDNATEDGDLAGSDWQLCYDAMYDGPYRPHVTVPFDGGELLVISIDSGGWVNALRVGDTIVLVEHSYTTVEDAYDEPAYDALFREADFLDWVTSPFDGEAVEAGLITVDSGALAMLPATSSGDEIPAARAALGSEDAMPFESLAECGVVTSLAAGQYVVRVENPVERSWGGAGRAVIEPR